MPKCHLSVEDEEFVGYTEEPRGDYSYRDADPVVLFDPEDDDLDIDEDEEDEFDDDDLDDGLDDDEEDE